MNFRKHVFSRLQALKEREPFEFPADVMPEDHKKAAVLIALWPAAEDSVEVVFTKRPETMSSHPGQVSFPGGRVDPEDETSAAAALREAHEELAIDPSQVSIMGRLDDAWSIAGHHVIPYVGWLQERPQMMANAAEVEQIIIGDIATLMHPDTACLHEHESRGGIRRSPAFKWDDKYVWGLTADMFFELTLWIKDEPSKRGDLRLDYVKIMQEAALNS